MGELATSESNAVSQTGCSGQEKENGSGSQSEVVG
jgi:hypothetical protein